ncbi:hypothetical protein MMC32_000740 [Xylographa parallela]|nr:hypothetical protein [Xylographa parallela]
MSPFAEIAAVEAAFANGHAGRVEEAATLYHNDKNLQAQILAKMAEGVAKIMETCRETVDNAWVYFVAADFDTKTALNTHAANWAQMDNLRDEETAAQDARDDRERADRWAAEGIKFSPVVFPHLAAATTAAPAAPAAAANPFILRITRATPDRTPDSPTIDAQAALLVDLFAGAEEDEDEEEEEPAAAETAAAIVAPVVAVPLAVVPAPAVPAPAPAPALPAAVEPVAAAAEGPKRGRKRKMVEELKSELVLEDAPRGKRARKPTFKAEASVPPTTASLAAAPAAKKTRAGAYIDAEETWIANWLQRQKTGSKTPKFKPDWTQLTTDFNAQFAGVTLAGHVGPRPERTKDSIYSNAHRVPAACAVLGAAVRGRSGNGGCYGKGGKKEAEEEEEEEEEEEVERRTRGVRGGRVEKKLAPVKRSKAAEVVMAAILGEKPARKGAKGPKK